MRGLFMLGLMAASAVLASTGSAQEDTARSSPRDRTFYTRPAIPDDIVRDEPPTDGNVAPAAIADVFVINDVVIANTDPTLKNTENFNDGETSIAVNPQNPNEIVITAFSSSWTASNAALWHSTNGGVTWTKRFTIPPPPGVTGTAGCPCDQVFDYGRNNTLFGTLMTSGGTNVYTGSTTDPANAAAWTWWTVGGVAQKTNLSATSLDTSDQPWLLRNRGTTNAANENVYVAYDDFGVNPVGMRVSRSINLAPPQFPAGSDQFVGSTSGAINPGHRLTQDPRNGWVYSLHQNCVTNCATLAANPKTIQYFLNRTTDQGSTWSLNGNAGGIVVATADSTQPQPKFGTVNALLGGVLQAAVDPSNGDLYYVYGNRDAAGNNRLAIRRVSDNGAGGVTIGAENFVVNGTVTAALPAISVTSNGAVGVFYYTYNGIVSGFPQFSTWLAVSVDQGVTFSAQKLATFLSPAVDNGNGRQRVWGDYHQMKTVGNCFYGAFTGNGAAFGRTTAQGDPIFFKACVPTWAIAGAGDVNKDARSDIFWRSSGGLVGYWGINGPQIQTAPILGSAGQDWQVAGIGDFNGDAARDLLWRRNDGLVGIWHLNGAQLLSAPVLGQVSTDWQIVGTGDLNGDGKADILWRRTDGLFGAWLMNGGQLLAAPIITTVPTDWSVVGTGDFNGDGRADILWRNANGDVAIWLMNGATILAGAVIANVDPAWQTVATGDLDGDGKSDIIWRKTNGELATWLMNGFTLVGAPYYGTVSTDWVIAGSGDFDGDGRSDILWRNISGAVGYWAMNGAAILSMPILGSAP